MQKDNIPVSVAAFVLMIVTIAYKMVLVILGFGVVIIRPAGVMPFLQPILGWCYLGIFLNVIFISFMLLLVFHPTMAKSIISAIIMALHKIHLIKRTDHYLNTVENAMQQYSDAAVYFRTHKPVVWNVFAITTFQRLVLFFVTYLTCRSFSIDGSGFFNIIILQGMISLAVDMLPLPGGMGISEKLFLTVFTPICGSITIPVMIVSRGLSFYTQLIICALLTLVAQHLIGRKKRGNI